MNDLTIVCISKVEAFASPFLHAMQDLSRLLECRFVIGADGHLAMLRGEAQFHHARIIPFESKGYLESIHDDCIRCCSTPYILRLDDDERASPALIDWLLDRQYRTDDHWKFPRANLWTPTSYINSPQLWPDHQTRLSVRSKMTGRNNVHDGSPFGGGRPAPAAIEHYKFIVKPYEERKKIAANYDRIGQGLGTGGMKAFNLPEDVYPEMPLEAWGDGRVDHQ